MSSAPAASAAGSAVAKRGARNSSPAPRAAGAKTDEAATEQKTVEETNAAADGKTGMDPGLIATLAAIPSAGLAVMLVAMSPAVQKILAQAFAKIAALWASVSSPVEPAMKEHSDLLVVLGSLTVCLPFIALLLVTAFRATCDLKHLPVIQKVALASLVAIALATGGWFSEAISTPINKLIQQFPLFVIVAAVLLAIASLTPIVPMFKGAVSKPAADATAEAKSD